MEYSKKDIEEIKTEVGEPYTKELEQELYEIQEQTKKENIMKRIQCPTVEECMKLLRERKSNNTAI